MVFVFFFGMTTSVMSNVSFMQPYHLRDSRQMADDQNRASFNLSSKMLSTHVQIKRTCTLPLHRGRKEPGAATKETVFGNFIFRCDIQKKLDLRCTVAVETVPLLIQASKHVLMR